MDLRVAALKPTTFFGRRLTRRQIDDIWQTAGMCPNDGRNELSKSIREQVGRTAPKGDCRVAAGLRLLEQLDSCGIPALPARHRTAPTSEPGPIVHVRASDPQPEMACGLDTFEPLALEAAASPEDVVLRNALADRCHCLGCPRPFGPCIRWFVRDSSGRFCPRGCWSRRSRHLASEAAT